MGVRAAPARRANWWLRLASWGTDVAPRSIEEREHVRKSRLAAYIILGILLVVLLLIPLGLGDPTGSLLPLIGAGVGVLISALFNRLGNVMAAALLLILIINAAVLASLISQTGGLTVDALPAFDLLVISVVVGASLLPGLAAFAVAAINVAAICLAFFLLPHASDLTKELTDPTVLGGGTLAIVALLSRPIALQIIIAVVAFLWVRGTDQAIRRADRAEEIAALEHTLADQKRQLDLGIQQILQTHVRAANGDYTARAPLGQDNILWQIASSLNNLLSRLQRSGQAEHQLNRTNEELRRLAAAIDDAQSGRKPIWPAPTGTAADLILERIRGGRRAAPQAVIQEQRPASGPSQPMSGFPGGPRSGWPDAMAQQAPPAQRAPSGWPDQMGPAQQPMEPAQNGGWPGQEPAQQFGQQNGGWPEPAESPIGDQETQDANPWAFPQDER
jgi:hypothetical protein